MPVTESGGPAETVGAAVGSPFTKYLSESATYVSGVSESSPSVYAPRLSENVRSV